MSMVELLKTVHQVEQESEELVAEAHKEAHKMLFEAETKKQESHAEVKKQIQEMEKKLVEDVRAETETQIACLNQENEHLIHGIRENAAQNMDAAIRFIAAKIMEE
ncbi:hypothetical protein HY792_01315 [Candidatus Desantisbacteria bacterium]|nr:hypothetical protein [Candidatus Desantisbacteria bacterium]